MLPLGIPQVLVLGSHEDFMPLTLVDAYVLATQAGDQVHRILITGAGHFEIASPLSFTWAANQVGHPVASRRKLPS